MYSYRVSNSISMAGEFASSLGKFSSSSKSFGYLCQPCHNPFFTQSSSIYLVSRQVPKRSSCQTPRLNDEFPVSSQLFFTHLQDINKVLVSDPEINTYVVNSLMFMGINVCVFETKPGLLGLIFAVTSGLINYLGTWIMFAGTYFCELKMVATFAK